MSSRRLTISARVIYPEPVGWYEWVRENSDGASVVSIAESIGVSPISVHRWRDSTPKPEHVRTFADAYGLRRVDAFVAAGLLDPADVSHVPAPPAGVATFSNRQLLDEIERRMTAPAAATPPPLHLAADTSTDDGVEKAKRSRTRGEETQDHGHDDPA